MTTARPQLVGDDDPAAVVAVGRVVPAFQGALAATEIIVSWYARLSEGATTALAPADLAPLGDAARQCILEIALLPRGLTPEYRKFAQCVVAMATALEQARILLACFDGLGETERAAVLDRLRSSVLPALAGEQVRAASTAIVQEAHRLFEVGDPSATRFEQTAERVEAWNAEARRTAMAAAAGVQIDRAAAGADEGAGATPSPAALPSESLEDVLSELDALIGLQPVKEQISGLANFLKVRRRRDELALKTEATSRHLVFVGSPGTGKTTVARLLGRIYHALELLPTGQVVEVARDDLVAGFVGQTAIKTSSVVDTALGGVLFIDEAYSLVPPDATNDFGRESVDTLLKRMEDDRDQFVLVAAGYPDEMERFLSSNPGLKSRFAEVVEFPDYSPSELVAILVQLAEKNGLMLTEEANSKAAEVLRIAWEGRDRTFGNARLVRNYFDDAMTRQANRLAPRDDLDVAALSTLEAEDMPEICE